MVDAAIATMFCNGIVNMQSMGLGGGFLMTIYTRDTKEALTLNAREVAPLHATPNMYDSDPSKARKGIKIHDLLVRTQFKQQKKNRMNIYKTIMSRFNLKRT